MKYWDGQEARLGDRVTLAGSPGVVVASMDTREYSAGHSEAQWGYLKSGVMIEFRQYGLIHYIVADEDLLLVARASSTGER